MLLNLLRMKMGGDKQEKKPSVIKDFLKNLDSYIYTAYVENGEIIVRAKKKGENV